MYVLLHIFQDFILHLTLSCLLHNRHVWILLVRCVCVSDLSWLNFRRFSTTSVSWCPWYWGLSFLKLLSLRFTGLSFCVFTSVIVSWFSSRYSYLCWFLNDSFLTCFVNLNTKYPKTIYTLILHICFNMFSIFICTLIFQDYKIKVKPSPFSVLNTILLNYYVSYLKSHWLICYRFLICYVNVFPFYFVIFYHILQNWREWKDLRIGDQQENLRPSLYGWSLRNKTFKEDGPCRKGTIYVPRPRGEYTQNLKDIKKGSTKRRIESGDCMLHKMYKWND